MKTKHSVFLFSLLIPVSLFFTGCPKEEDEESQLTAFYNSASDEIDVSSTIKYVVTTNSAGSITFAPKSADGLLNSFLYKTIWAESQTEANLHFKDITFNSSVSSDSVKYVVTAPPSTSSLKYTGNLTVQLPGSVVPIVRSPNKGVKSTSLVSTVLVYGSEGAIDISKHNGAVELRTSNGNINVGFTFFRNGGFCRCYTENGNITIEIPKSVSATLSAKTGNGTVTYSNLTIIDKVESPGILTGTLAIGSGEIHLETKKGNITIKGI